MSNGELSERLRNARGQNYTRLFKIADVQIGDCLRREFLEIKEKNGKVSWRDLGGLALRHNLPVTTMFRMLEGAVLPSGTWEIAQQRGLTATKLLQGAQEK